MKGHIRKRRKSWAVVFDLGRDARAEDSTRGTAALSRYRRSVAVNVAGNRRHAMADAPAQVRNEPARSSLKCGRRSR